MREESDDTINDFRELELVVAANESEVKGHDQTRRVRCPYCHEWFSRTIIPHLKTDHPKKWGQWGRDMLTLFNRGLSPGQIIRRCGMLFTWRIVESEIMKVSERLHIPIEPSLNRSHTWISNPPKNESRIERTTVWSFPKRGDWAVHKGDYKGNWPPQLVLNLLARFSKKGGLVLDPFVGGGTTLIECWRLGYRSIGTDVSPHALSFSRKRLSDMQRLWPKDRPLSRDLKPVLIKADARNLGFLSDNQIDFICGQPPYWNSQKYSASQRGDLSGITEIDVFIDAVRLVAKELFRVLKPSKNCAILIGDVRRKGKFTILSHQVWQIFEQAGFETEENLVKIQHRDKSTAFYAGSRRSPRYRIKHEHLYVFRKPADQK